MGSREFLAALVFFHGILTETPGIHKRGGGILIAPSTDKMRLLRRRPTVRADEGLLAEVFDAEKAAAAAIAAAKRDAEAWLDAQRRAIADAKEAGMTALAAQAAEREQAARAAAVAEAAKIVVDADTFSRQLRALRDDELQPLAARHMASLIPESAP